MLKGTVSLDFRPYMFFQIFIRIQPKWTCPAKNAAPLNLKMRFLFIVFKNVRTSDIILFAGLKILQISGLAFSGLIIKSTD
jgi:hypothetical protein